MDMYSEKATDSRDMIVVHRVRTDKPKGRPDKARQASMSIKQHGSNGHTGNEPCMTPKGEKESLKTKIKI